MGKRAEESEGRTERIVATGTFDLIHPGHIFYLSQAKSLGDELFVVVARDSTGDIEPVIPEKQRRNVIEALEPVDKAVLGSETNKLDPIKKIRPNKIALGPDQAWDKSKVEDEINKNLDFDVEVVQIDQYKNCQLCSTSEIIEKIKRTC